MSHHAKEPFFPMVNNLFIYNFAGFSGVLGCVDGTIVKKARLIGEADYICCQRYYALIIRVCMIFTVCDTLFSLKETGW